MLASITIDVDSLHHYRAIHGLQRRADDRPDPIYTTAMERFWGLLSEVGVPATLFLIGADAPEFAKAFEPVGPTGSEIANHSWAHDYQLTRKTSAQIAADLKKADNALRPLNRQQRIAGFRAPGYNVSPPLLEAVRNLGYAYDSSLLPSPLYHAARRAAILAHRLRGRRSRSLPGNRRQFSGPLGPYRMRSEVPWEPSSKGDLLELPIACEPRSRAPLIGTSWVTMPKRLQEIALSSALGKSTCEAFVFEMHAIDLLDETDDPALRALGPYQRDLRIPAIGKLASLSRLFRRLRSAAEVMPLRDVASRWADRA